MNSHLPYLVVCIRILLVLYSYVTRTRTVLVSYSYLTSMYSYVVHMCSLSHDLCHDDHRTIANKLTLIIIAKNTTVIPDLEVFLEGLKYSTGNLRHKTDGLLLIVGRYKLLSYLRAIFIRRGDLTGGFLYYEFWGLVFGGVAHGWAYFRNFTVRDEHALNFGFFFFCFFGTVGSTFVLFFAMHCGM